MASIYKPTPAPIIRRIAAFIVDVILFFTILTGVMYVTSFATGYQKNADYLEEKYIEYGVKIKNEDNEYVFCDEGSESCNIALEAFNKDELACKYYDKNIELTTLILTISVGITFAITEYAVPLILKNGRTVGMYLFKISFVTKDDVRVKHINIFVRALFGKFLVTTMIPIYALIFMAFNLGGGFLGTVLLLGILGCDIIMKCSGERKIGIADSIGMVYPVDTDTTYFVDSIEELNELKGKEYIDKNHI